jgi:hypothetical protein
MSLIPTAIQSDIVSPVDVLAMCVSTSQGGPAPTPGLIKFGILQKKIGIGQK